MIKKQEVFTAKVLLHRDGRPYLRDLKSGDVLKLSRKWKKNEVLRIVVTLK
jgi:hypothetical protein